jgi:hypothetical protein
MSIMAEYVFPVDNDISSLQYIKTLDDCIKTLENEEAWDVLMRGKIQIDDHDPIRTVTELLGVMRHTECVTLLVKHIGTITRSVGGLPKGFKDAFVAVALVRIGSPSIEPVLKEYQNPSELFMGMYVTSYFRALLPIESSLAIIDDYISCNLVNLTEEQKERLSYLRKTIESYQNDKRISVPQPNDFILRHSLYKDRQKVIEEKIMILKSSTNFSKLDNQLLSAIQKLGELRAIDAVDILVPNLLLKHHSDITRNSIATTEKYKVSDYPVVHALVMIDIPSIVGLLDEIAINNHDEQYYKIAYQTMTTILPAVAIPGFVNESLKKHTGELEQLRLYKMYPLMGLPIEDTPLIPQFREWQSTDKLFKTTAKFISLDKEEVILERTNGKRTTIEFSALRKEDQDYVKEQTTQLEKLVEKEKK